jgi:hypothetical protein
MDLSEMLSIALKVISDWRVVFITVAVLVVFTILRYVGIVYHKRPRTRARPPLPTSAAEPSGGGQAGARHAGGGRAEASGEGPGSGMIE